MIVITGALGFIGSFLASECIRQKKTDRLALVDLVPSLKRADVAKHLMELAEAQNVSVQFFERSEFENLVRSGDLDTPTGIFHMGACSSTTESRWDYLKDVNVRSSQILMSWARAHRAPILYASSAATYGDGSAGFSDLTPHQNLKPLNLYGESKRQFDIWAETTALEAHRWYGLKFFNVFGPNEYFKGDMASVVFKSFGEVALGNPLRLFKSYKSEYGDGEQVRDFVYVKDIVHWMLQIFENAGVPSGVYNMGTGLSRSWKDLALSLFDALGEAPRIEFIEMPEALRERYQYFTEAKMEKLLSHLQPPKWTLESAIKDYVQNYLSTGPGPKLH